MTKTNCTMASYNNNNNTFSSIILYFCYRSQTLLLDRRMFQPRRPYFDGPKRRRIVIPESKLKISRPRGVMVLRLMPLFTAIDPILWIGKKLTEDKYGRGLTSLSMLWKGNMVWRDFLIQKVSSLHFLNREQFRVSFDWRIGLSFIWDISELSILSI